MTDERENESTWRTIWSGQREPVGGEAYARLIIALRRFLAAFAGAAIGDGLAAVLTRLLECWTSKLLLSAVSESEQFYAQRPDLEGRGQATSPAIRFVETNGSELSGCVTFDRYFLGSNGAAHGGAIAFMFDEAAGRLAHLDDRPTARTAYLRTTYRSIAPIDTILSISGKIVREEGRKRFLHLELRKGGTVCAEADVLMVALKPGQA